MNAIQEFEAKVSGLYESEYGDFKRKLGLYITRLEQDLGGQLTSPKKAKIEGLKQQIVYCPETTDIEQARQIALRIAQEIKAD